MPWSVNIDGTNYTEDMFAQFNYVQNFPRIMQSVANVGALAQTFVSGLTFGNSFRNRLRNGNFTINQRAVSGTVTLAAAAYGHDGFKAGAGGCSYTFAKSGGVTTLTITAGTLVQVIEGALYLTEGGQYTLSWVGTAQARINGGAYAASPITVSGLTAEANATIEWSAGTLALPMFEPGAKRTAFEYRDDELRRCHRYYFSSYPEGVAPGTANVVATYTAFFPTNGAFQVIANINFMAPMRAAPTMIFYSPKTGAAGKAYANNLAKDVGVNTPGFGRFGVTVAVSEDALYGVQINMVASAEL